MEFVIGDAAIDTFREANTDRYVVFQRGTAVKIGAAVDDAPFDANYANDWPIECLADPNDFPDIMSDNFDRYAEVAHLPHINAAYCELLRAGYPAADSTSNRAVFHVAGNIWRVVYPNIDYDVINIVETPHGADVAAALAGEYRRLDWLFPRVLP